MTLDISNLSQKQQTFLKANPDFLKSLEAEIPKQVQKIHTRKLHVNKGKAKWQRDLEEAERLRREYDPLLREIQEKMTRKEEFLSGGLVCPVCQEPDKGNKMNGKAWCMKCNAPLLPKSKAEKWKKLGNIKIANSKPLDPTFIEEEKK